MPSQRLTVFRLKSGSKKGTIYIVKKSGYLDIWINGQHFYYNYSGSIDNLSDFDIQRIIEDVQSKQNGKKTIIIRGK